MSKSPDQQTEVSHNHTCAMLVRAQIWTAMASSGQSRQGTSEDQKPSGWWEQETGKAAKFQEGAINSVLAGLMRSCPACSTDTVRPPDEPFCALSWVQAVKESNSKEDNQGHDNDSAASTKA